MSHSLQSGIERYEWTVVHDDLWETPVAPRMPAYRNTKAYFESKGDMPFVQPGMRYRCKVWAINKAGLETARVSQPFVPDHRPPTCNMYANGAAVREMKAGTTQELDFAADLSSIRLEWDCSDAETFVDHYTVQVGLFPGDSSIYSENVGNVSSVTIGADVLQPQPHLTYYASVLAFDGTKSYFWTVALGSGVLVDDTPPLVRRAHLQPGARFVSTTESFKCMVKPEAVVDIESFVGDTVVGLCSANDETGDIAPFRQLPGVAEGGGGFMYSLPHTSVETKFYGLGLQHGDIVTCCVCGVNKAGVRGCARSDEARVDMTPPEENNLVIDGMPGMLGFTGRDIDYTQFPTVAVFFPGGFLDPESFIAAYELRVLDSNGRVVLPWQRIYPSQDSIAAKLRHLLPGQHIVELRVHNGAGLYRDYRTDGFVLDSSKGHIANLAPAIELGMAPGAQLHTATVVDGAPPTLQQFLSTAGGDGGGEEEAFVTLTAYFQAWDDQSGIVEAVVVWGTTPGDDSLAVLPLPLSTTSDQYAAGIRAMVALPAGLVLQSGRRLCPSVRVRNGAASQTVLVGACVVVDSEPPVAGRVIDGMEELDRQCQMSTGTVSAHWSPFYDAHTGVAQFRAGVGSTPFAADVRALQVVPGGGEASSALITGLQLSSDKRYHVVVEAVDYAGNRVLAASDGLWVDNTPPTFPTGHSAADAVRVVPNTDCTGQASLLDAITDASMCQEHQSYISTRTSVRVQWSNAEEGGVPVTAHMALAKADKPTQLITSLVDVSNREEYLLTGLRLSSGDSFVVVMIFTNPCGGSVTALSPVFTVDSSEPICTFKLPEQAPGCLPSGANSAVLPLGYACVDPDSNIVSTTIAFGTKPGTDNVMPYTAVSAFASVGQLPSWLADSILPLEEGGKLFATLDTINGAGLRIMQRMWQPLVRDTTAPVPRFVRIGTPSERLRGGVTVVTADGVLQLGWSFADASHGAGIEYSVTLVHPRTGTTLWTHTAGTNRSAVVPPGVVLEPSEYYEAHVTATDVCGNSGASVSDAFLVATTPECTQVLHGAPSQPSPQCSVASVVEAHWSCTDQATDASQLEYKWMALEYNNSVTRSGDALADLASGLAKELQSWMPTPVGEARASSGDVDVTPGSSVVVLVIARGAARVWTEAIASAALRFDETQPVVAAVADTGDVEDAPQLPAVNASTVDARFQTSTTTVGASVWVAQDAESGITHIEWWAGTTPGAADIVSRRLEAVGSALGDGTLYTLVSASGLTLEHGQRVYVSVVAVNGCGKESLVVVTNGVLVDTTPPQSGTVDARTVFGGAQGSDASVIVSWQDMYDPESTLADVQVSVRTASDGAIVGQLVQGKKAVSGSASVPVAVDEVVGDIVGCVTATNHVGLATTTCSEAVSLQPPTLSAGAVHDGGRVGHDSDMTSSPYSIAASWDGFTYVGDDDTSIHYEWCVGTSSGSCDLIAMGTNGAMSDTNEPHFATSFAVYDAPPTKSGVTLYTTVKATAAPELSVSVTSDGILVDTRAPLITFVGCGGTVGESLRFLRLPAAVTLTASDEDGGLATCELCVGKSPGGADLVACEEVKDAQGALPGAPSLSLVHTFTPKQLPSGTAFFVTATCTDVAGLVASRSSHSCIVDDTPPGSGYVAIVATPLALGEALVAGTAVRTYDDLQQRGVCASWQGFLDSGACHMQCVLPTFVCLTTFPYHTTESTQLASYDMCVASNDKRAGPGFDGFACTTVAGNATGACVTDLQLPARGTTWAFHVRGT